jgi:hypothetical protein
MYVVLLSTPQSRDSVLRLGLASGWTICGSNPGRGRDFSVRQKVQTGTEAQPASYSVGTGGSLWGRGQVVRLSAHRKIRVCLHGVYRDSLTLPF